jgi:hypothetical protein
MNQKRKFLACFTNVAPQGFTTPAAATQAPPVSPISDPNAAPTMVPITSVVDMAERLAARELERRQQAQAYQQQRQAPLQAVVAPAPEPPVDHSNEISNLAKSVRELTRNLAASEAARKTQELEIYRANAIANVRSGGRELIDAMVFGNSTQEVDTAIAVAIAEYETLQRQWAARMQQQVPQLAPAVSQPVAVAPQAMVTSSGLTVQPQDQPPPSLPGYYAVPGVPDNANSGRLTPEQFQELTSSESIRNGTYAANRHLLHGQLRQGMRQPPERWAFDPGYTLSAPMPQGVMSPPGMAAPGVRPMTQVQQAGMIMPMVNHAQPGVPGVPTRGLPSQSYPGVGPAPQPAQFQHDLGQGQYAPGGVPGPGQVASARAAAQASLRSAQGQYAASPHDR